MRCSSNQIHGLPHQGKHHLHLQHGLAAQRTFWKYKPYSDYLASPSGRIKLQAHVKYYSSSMLQGASKSQGRQRPPDVRVCADHPDHVSQLAALFQERPAWSQASLCEKLPDCPAQILQQLLLNQQCYIFRNGERCHS